MINDSNYFSFKKSGWDVYHLFCNARPSEWGFCILGTWERLWGAARSLLMVNEKRPAGRSAQCKAKVISSQETRPVQFIFHLPHGRLAFGAALLARRAAHNTREKRLSIQPRQRKQTRACARNVVVAFRKHIKNVRRANWKIREQLIDGGGAVGYFCGALLRVGQGSLWSDPWPFAPPCDPPLRRARSLCLRFYLFSMSPRERATLLALGVACLVCRLRACTPCLRNIFGPRLCN